MQIRPRVGDPTVLADLTDTAGINLGGAAGTIEIVISAAQTMALTGTKAVYDLYVHFPNGDVVKVLDGKVTITLSVTSPVFP